MAGTVEQAGKAVIDNGENTSDLFPAIENFLRTAGERAAPRVLPFFGVAIADVLDAVIAFIMALGGWAILLGIVILLFALRIFGNILVNAIHAIPFFGPKIAPHVRSWLGFLTNIEDWVLRGIADQTGAMLHSIFVIVGIASDAHQAQQAKSLPAPRAAPGQYVTVQEGQYLQHQINVLNQRMNYVQYVLDPTFLTSGATVPAPSPAPQPSTTTTIIRTGVPANVWAQIHALQADVSTLRGDMTNAFHQLDRLTSTDTSLQREFNQLSGSIHSIRAVATGWQEIEDQLQLVSAVLLDFTDTAAAQFAKHDRLLTRLEPLNLLQQPGLPGLKILRQLEDTPCMCPKLPNIPRLAPELLALYEFATHG